MTEVLDKEGVTLLTVLYDAGSVTQCFLHRLLLHTDTERNHLMVVYNKDTNARLLPALEQMYENGLISELIVRDNVPGIRGSDNHKAGISRAVPCIKTEKTVLLDCDTLVAGANWLPDLLAGATNKALYGVKSHGRGFVHPSMAVINTGILQQYRERLTCQYEKEGDTLEILSSLVPKEEIGFLKSEGKHHQYYATGNALLAFHPWTDSRNEELQYELKEKYLADICIVIPTYGDYQKDIEIIESTLKANRITYLTVCGWYKDGRKDKWQFLTPRPTTSKSLLMNIGFLRMYADRYVFLDRDCMIGPQWIHEALECKEQIALAHGGAVYESEDIQVLQPGLAMYADWSTFWNIGGYDIGMEGWGLEDREFYYRACKVMNVKELPRFKSKLVHAYHTPRDRKDDAMRAPIRAAMENGSLDISSRRYYLRATLQYLKGNK